MSEVLTGKQFKAQLREGRPKIGLYVNSADDVRQYVTCCRYPTAGTRSVYFPQRSMNVKGLLGYAGDWNENVIAAIQVETADCIKNIDEIAAVPGVDMMFLGQNDLC